MPIHFKLKQSHNYILMQNDQADNQSPSLGDLINQIQNIDNVFNDPSDDQSSGNDVVLVLGNTGSGKGTLIAHALGYDLIAEQNDVGNLILSTRTEADINVPIIGHGTDSQTQYPSRVR